MRRYVPALALALALALVPSAAAATPSLRVAELAPLEVRGAGFVAREKIRVVLVLHGARYARTVVATAGGRFVARFARSLDPCADHLVRAIGRLGSRAVARARPPLGGCAAP